MKECEKVRNREKRQSKKGKQLVAGWCICLVVVVVVDVWLVKVLNKIITRFFLSVTPLLFVSSRFSHPTSTHLQTYVCNITHIRVQHFSDFCWINLLRFVFIECLPFKLCIFRKIQKIFSLSLIHWVFYACVCHSEWLPLWNDIVENCHIQKQFGQYSKIKLIISFKHTHTHTHY